MRNGLCEGNGKANPAQALHCQLHLPKDNSTTKATDAIIYASNLLCQ